MQESDYREYFRPNCRGIASASKVAHGPAPNAVKGMTKIDDLAASQEFGDAVEQVLHEFGKPRFVEFTHDGGYGSYRFWWGETTKRWYPDCVIRQTHGTKIWLYGDEILVQAESFEGAGAIVERLPHPKEGR